MTTRDDQGQSLVEFALIVPIIALLVFATNYLVDLTRYRLKNHEAARYAAFAMAKLPLTDYQDSRHALAFQSAQGKVTAEVTARFQDLDWSASRTEAQSLALNGQLTLLRLSHEAPPLVFPADAATKLGSAAGSPTLGFILGLVSGLLNGGVGLLVDAVGYNGSGLIRAHAESSFQNHLMPSWARQPLWWKRSFPAGDAERLNSFTLQDTVALNADPWGLGDGRNVRPGGFVEETEHEALMHKQVARLYGFKGALSKAQMDEVADEALKLSRVLSFSTKKFAGAFEPRVASYNYRSGGDGSDSGDGSDGGPGTIDVYKVNGLTGGKGWAVHDTTHMADRLPRNQSPNVRALKARGPYFMGCPDPQAIRCDYRRPVP